MRLDESVHLILGLGDDELVLGAGTGELLPEAIGRLHGDRDAPTDGLVVVVDEFREHDLVGAARTLSFDDHLQVDLLLGEEGVEPAGEGVRGAHGRYYRRSAPSINHTSKIRRPPDRCKGGHVVQVPNRIRWR